MPKNLPLANLTTTGKIWDYIKYITQNKTYKEYFSPYTDVDWQNVFDTACAIYKVQTGNNTGMSTYLASYLNFNPHFSYMASTLGMVAYKM
jgi:hypothetical protein